MYRDYHHFDIYREYDPGILNRSSVTDPWLLGVGMLPVEAVFKKSKERTKSRSDWRI